MSERLVDVRRLLAAAALVTAGYLPASAQPVRISVATDGTLANDSSLVPSLSETGRFVAFLSFASNLVPGDTNGAADIFLRDRDTDADGVLDEPGAVATVRVSQRGAIQGNGPSFHPVITPDGRFVFFESAASSLFSAGQPALPFTEILRWDRLTGDIVLVSRNDAGEPLDQRAFWPAPTDDGNVAYFVTYASNGPVAAAGTGGMLVRRDIAAGTLTAWSDPLPTPTAFPLTIEQPSVSGDGRVVAFGIVERDPVSANVRVGGTIRVKAVGAVERTFAGVEPHLSRDGAVLLGIDSRADAHGPAFRVHLPTGEVRRIGEDIPLFGAAEAGSASASGRYLASGAFFADFRYDSWTVRFLPRGTVAFDGLDRFVAYTRSDATTERQFEDLFLLPSTAFFDADSDGLDDHWEALFYAPSGSGGSAVGDAGPAGDPDHDGLTNAQEFAAGSNPLGTQARYLAEGASGTFFSTRYALANSTASPATVAVRFDTDDGTTTTRGIVLPAHSRRTLDSHAEGLDGRSFSARFESDRPLAVDRLMTWGDPGSVPYGSHAETSSVAPGTSWFLAEGSTVLGFQLFYLLQNPQETPTTATIRYLLPSGVPIVRTYELSAHSRTTVAVNDVPGLAATDVSAEITAAQPIAVERAMYRSGGDQTFALGHDAAAVAQPSASWFFGEGATGSFFDTYLLLANPSAQTAAVQVNYLLNEGAAVARTYVVPANSRFSVYVDGEPGMASTSFGTRVTSDVPIVAERAMYWAGGYFDYYEGHVSAGATQTGSHWLLAEGESGGVNRAVTFVLVANTGPTTASVLVRTLPDGPEPSVNRAFSLPGNSRVTVAMSTVPGFARGGIEVLEQGTPTGALVVEGSMYWSAGSVPFAAGANWPATRIP